MQYFPFTDGPKVPDNPVTGEYVPIETTQKGDKVDRSFKFGTVSDVAKITASLFPGGKFLIGEEREKFAKLNEQQQQVAIAAEAVFGIFFLATPAIFTGGRALIGMGSRGVGKALLKTVPKLPEDIVSIATGSYVESLTSRLAKKGFNEVESIGIVKHLRTNNPTALKNVALQQAKTGASASWKGSIETGGNFAAIDGSLRLSAELAKDLTPTALQRQAVKEGWRDTLKLKSVLGDYEASAKVEDAIFQNQMRRYYGKDLAATKTLKNATEREISAATADILRSPNIVHSTINPGRWQNIKPVQVLFGAGDEVHGTWKKFRKVEVAVGNTNIETLKYVHLLQSMAAERGLGSLVIKEKAGKMIVIFKPNKAMLTVGTRENAKAALESIDGMLGKLHKLHPKDPMGKEIIKRTYSEVNALKKGMDDGSKALLEVSHSFFDRLYADHTKLELRNIINSSPLSARGVVTADRMLEKMTSQIENVFGTGSKYSYTEKITAINEMLGGLRSDLTPHLIGSKQELRSIQKRFASELTMGGEGEWMSYLDHYTPRLYESAQKTTSDVMNILSGDLKPFYMKPRAVGEGALPQVDWETMMSARIRAHTKRFHLYPTMTEVAREVKVLPEQWRELYGHWYARLLNIPSDMDNRIASVMTGSIGKIERVLGKSGVWDGYRVSRLASTINDGVYAGILGANPWSAGRNSLQPFLNVPADFGGVSNYGKLLRQYARLGDDKVWAKLNKIGVFTDYAPELTQKSAMLGLGRKIGNLAIPRSDKFRDWSMWGFHGADRINRFVTGSMALDDFALAATKVPQITEGKGVSTFMRHAGVKHTQPWIQKEVEYFLRNRQFAMAEEVFAKAKVGDTQYLYGSLYSPIISQTWGAFGKTGVVFNSWWMNYGQLVKKWMTTGDVDMATSKLFAWMTSSAMMYTAIEPIWGDAKAINSTLFGPFPGFQTAKNVAEGRTSKIPDANLDLISGVSPVWRVPVEAMRTFAQAGAMLLGGGDDKAAIAQMNSFRKSFMNITVPAWNVTEKVLSQVDKGPAAMGKAFIGIPKFR